MLSGSNGWTQKTSAGVAAGVQVNNGTLVVQNAAGLGALTAANILAQGTGVLRLDGIVLQNTGVTLDASGGNRRRTATRPSQRRSIKTTATNVLFGTTSATDVFTVGTAAGAISGGSAATVIRIGGPGQVAVNNTSTATGTWKVMSSGSLNVASGATLGTASLAFDTAATGRIVLNGNSMTIGGLEGGVAGAAVENGAASDLLLTVNSGTAQSFGGDIRNGSGGGKISLTKGGLGTLTLNGNQTYTGSTIINSGKLSVNGNWASSDITVNNSGYVGGNAVAGGPVTVHSGGHIAPGASVGLFSAASLTLDSGAVLDYEFNSSANDQIVVSGSNAFTLNGGAFNLFQENSTLGLTTQGTYQLVQFAGGIQGTGLDSTWTTASTANPHVLNPQPGLKYAFGTSGSYLTLTVSAGAFSAAWAVDADGSWGAGSNWSTNPQFPQNAGEVANFTKVLTAVRTVTLDGNKTVGGLQFDPQTAGTGYVIAPGTGGSLTIDNSGAPATIIVTSGNNTIGVPVVLNSNTLTSVVPANASLAFTAPISGAGNFSKNGAGTISLMAANTYSGSTTISGGTVEVGDSAAFSSSAVSVAGTLTLRSAAANVSLPNAIALGDQVVMTVDTQTNTFGLGGAITNTNANGSLVKVGSGTLVLTNAASYAGNTTISAGTLELGTGGSIANAIVDNAALLFNSSADVTSANVISGTGAVYKSNTNTLTLGAANSYTGGTGINAGTLKVGIAGALGTNGPVAIASAGTLDLNGIGVTVGALSGAGRVDSSTSANMTLSVGNDNRLGRVHRHTGEHRWHAELREDRHRQSEPQRYSGLCRQHYRQQRHAGDRRQRKSVLGNGHDSRKRRQRRSDRGG